MRKELFVIREELLVMLEELFVMWDKLLVMQEELLVMQEELLVTRVIYSYYFLMGCTLLKFMILLLFFAQL